MRIAALLVGLIVVLYSSGYQLLVGLGRDAPRTVDQELTPKATRRGRIYAATALTVLSGYIGVLAYAWYLFHVNTRSGSTPPLASELVSLDPTTMELRIKDSDGRPVVGLQPDHGKMMHMVAVDVTGATRFFHLHPRQVGAGQFQFATLPQGKYKLFADVVCSPGEGETVTANLDVSTPATGSTRAIGDPDDSFSDQLALDAFPVNQKVYDIGDGLKMTWIQQPVALRVGEFQKLTFELSAADGKPLPLEPYMGMDGHLLIMRADGNIFAHVHPMGTVPALMMMTGMMQAHASHDQVSFPYGFPDKGLYRLWVQVKYQGRVRTGVFDVIVN